jgi:hypothetical protein
VPIYEGMPWSWIRTLLLGIAASVVGPLVWISGGSPAFAEYDVVWIFTMGPALQTVAALAALRCSESPVERVLRTGVAYWAGATIGWVVVWADPITDVVPGTRAFSFVVNVVAWSWAMAGIFTLVIAGVTGSVHAWRARS